jgi:biotin carboxyl carrier protein
MNKKRGTREWCRFYVLVLEAMKMETVITLSLAGKVARAHVNVGDAVLAGPVLVEFE